MATHMTAREVCVTRAKVLLYVFVTRWINIHQLQIQMLLSQEDNNTPLGRGHVITIVDSFSIRGICLHKPRVHVVPYSTLNTILHYIGSTLVVVGRVCTLVLLI